MLAHSIVALYGLLPVMVFSSYSLLSGAFYVLTTLALVLICKTRATCILETTQKYRWLIISYSILFLAIAISSLFHGTWAGANSEGALRFFIGLWILMSALPLIDEKLLQHGLWGIYAATVVSTLVLLWLIFQRGPRPLTPGVILTTYSSIMLLLGAICVYSLKWKLTKYYRFEVTLKVLLALVAVVGFLASQTRTGLLGLPLFVAIALMLFLGVRRPGRAIVWFFLLGALIAIAIAVNDGLSDRITQGLDEIKTCMGENRTAHSSMCIRLQLWRTALEAGSSNPWIGLGDGGNFSQYVKDVAIPKGLAAPYILEEHFGEPHNDLLLMYVGFGIPGTLGLILIYLAPCVYLGPRLWAQDIAPQKRAAAAMGLAFCLGFLLFGLTETMFRRMNTIGLYTAMVAFFLIMSEPALPKQKSCSISRIP